MIVTSRHHLALHLDVPSAIEIKLGELPSEVHLNADPLAPSLWTRAHSFVVERCVVASRYAVHVEFAIRVHVRAGVAVGRIVWAVATCHSSRRRVHFPTSERGHRGVETNEGLACAQRACETAKPAARNVDTKDCREQRKRVAQVSRAGASIAPTIEGVLTVLDGVAW